LDQNPFTIGLAEEGRLNLNKYLLKLLVDQVLLILRP
jgi:hypothetical protein